MSHPALPRRALVPLGAALLARPVAAQPALDDLAAFLADEVENRDEAPRDPRVGELLALWLRQTPRERARWAEDEASLDYAPLADRPASDAEFRLTAAQLRQLAALNSFALPADTRTPVLFGLRGCTLAEPTPAAPQASLLLREAVPDHLRFRCVIGILQGDRLLGFRASTVPNAAFVWAQRRLYAERLDRPETAQCCNLLPTGLHRYVVGLHNRSHPQPERRVPGMLVQGEPVSVSRSFDDLSFTNKDPVRPPAMLGNNVHPGFFGEGTPDLAFSSAGCQVMPGGWANGRLSGDAAMLFASLGLARRDGAPFVRDGSTSTPEREGAAMTYMLLTGREARLVTEGRSAELRRLRHGSSGEAVRGVRRALGLPAGDRLDGMAVHAFAAWHQRQSADGVSANVVTPQIARRLGVTLG